jgi:alpha-beta hydrolase superfamily lysophospholipase
MTNTTSINGTVGAEEATARMTDGTILRTLRWAARDEPRGQVQIVHGLGEHGGRYQTVADPLTAAGFEVHAYDHRGFGASAGPRAYVDRWSQYHDDLQQRLGVLRSERPDLPLVIYGHSMGGLISLGYVLAEPARPLPDLLVLSAPGLDADLPEWKKVMAHTLQHVAPKMRIPNGLPDGGLSADPEVDAAVEVDPLCLPTSTVKFGAAGFDEQVRVRAQVAALRDVPVPTYVLHGSADPIVPLRATEALGRLPGVTRRVHEGLRHECHHAPRHAEVLAEVVAWLDTHVPAGMDVRGDSAVRV